MWNFRTMSRGANYSLISADEQCAMAIAVATEPLPRANGEGDPSTGRKPHSPARFFVELFLSGTE